MLRVTLYSRHGCHLCEEMRAVVAAVERVDAAALRARLRRELA